MILAGPPALTKAKKPLWALAASSAPPKALPGCDSAGDHQPNRSFERAELIEQEYRAPFGGRTREVDSTAHGVLADLVVDQDQLADLPELFAAQDCRVGRVPAVRVELDRASAFE